MRQNALLVALSNHFAVGKVLLATVYRYFSHPYLGREGLYMHGEHHVMKRYMVKKDRKPGV